MRRIKLKKLNSLTFRITRQPYREREFNGGSITFMSSNGLSLVSASVPEVPEEEVYATVFVRGDCSSEDNRLLIFKNQADVDRFLFAVNEYNEYGCQCTSALLCKYCMSDVKGALSF